MAFIIDVFARRIVGWKAFVDAAHGLRAGCAWSRPSTSAVRKRRQTPHRAFGPRKSIHEYSVHRAPGRSRHRAVGGQRRAIPTTTRLAETINGLYKAEVIHRRRWPSRAAVEMATLEWVNWYNHRRLLEPIGDIPPAEAEAQLLSSTFRVTHGGVTHTTEPPRFPGRFRPWVTSQYDLNPLSERSALLLRSSGDSGVVGWVDIPSTNSNLRRSEPHIFLEMTISN